LYWSEVSAFAVLSRIPLLNFYIQIISALFRKEVITAGFGKV
jgi:hypothetical protein